MITDKALCSLITPMLDLPGSWNFWSRSKSEFSIEFTGFIPLESQLQIIRGIADEVVLLRLILCIRIRNEITSVCSQCKMALLQGGWYPHGDPGWLWSCCRIRYLLHAAIWRLQVILLWVQLPGGMLLGTAGSKAWSRWGIQCLAIGR